jgi:ectoine hydroxylase-related dioxygenase (phytanoyl-CoA dioxygenase family)
MPSNTDFLAGQTVGDELIDQWIEQFHRDGFLFLKNILPPDLCEELSRDLETALADNPELGEPKKFQLNHRMFEVSKANLRLFDMEPIVTFAERLINTTTHIIHNNSFKVPKGGGLIGWHQDDSPHLIVTHGEPPTNIRLPVMLFTANYYLTDVDAIENGPTQLMPGSHLFGKPPPEKIAGTEYEDKIFSAIGPAGSVIMFNNQVWHRGAPNQSDRVRYITQVSYARRLVGHKYKPFMNYIMPEHVYRDADERLKRLLGFLPSGAYG